MDTRCTNMKQNCTKILQSKNKAKSNRFTHVLSVINYSISQGSFNFASDNASFTKRTVVGMQRYVWVFDSPREIVAKKTNAAKAGARLSVRYPDCILFVFSVCSQLFSAAFVRSLKSNVQRSQMHQRNTHANNWGEPESG